MAKKVYLSFLLHGNMCYDRYTKQEIRQKFPEIYAAGIRAMHKFPQVTAHIDFPGLTTLSLKHHAQWFLEELRPLVERGQVMMVGCQYAASHALCADEESDLLAGRLSMEIMRDEIDPGVCTYFPQEIVFHPQFPYIMNQIGARYLVIAPDWPRPRWVRGIDGSQVIVCSRDPRLRLGDLDKALEDFYDRHQDGDFMLAGGDFEMLGNVEQFVQAIQRLADKGKIIEWMTIERYEKEIGIQDACDAPTPFRASPEDLIPSPSFSRWVGDPEDMIWHGYAVRALDAIRSASFAKLSAELHALGKVDVPLTQRWTTEPDNGWDHYFEHALEYPETEAKYLTPDGVPTLLSRAWHHLLIGLNSDASGWYPWQPRTRHRNIVLQSSRALSEEVLHRFAHRLAAKIKKPEGRAAAHVLALNPMPERSVEISLETQGPMAFVEPSGQAIPTMTLFQDGQWLARARVALPSYGYKLLGLAPTQDVLSLTWKEASETQWGERRAALSEGKLVVSQGEKQVEVSVLPFRLSDPSGVAETEWVTPTWEGAKTRVRETPLGNDLEVFTELAWAVWLQLTIGLRVDRIEVTAQVHIDMPRRFGKLGYDPEGLLLAFTGQAGHVYYDIPYAVIRHPNDEASFVAAQRFAALESAELAFGLIALGGNQSFRVAAKEGSIAANLGASTEGRPDTRPQCIIRPDGTAEHRITSGGDPFMGTYRHRFALIFGDRRELALSARRLRTAVPLVYVNPGDGPWPAAKSLLTIDPPEAWVTAFRTTPQGAQVVVNDLSGQASRVSMVTPRGEAREADLVPYGVVTLTI